MNTIAVMDMPDIGKGRFYLLCGDQKLFPDEGYPLSNENLSHVHLQWFASEDEGRTEDPTEQRIRKAREEGRVAKSSELTTAVGMLLSVVLLGIFGSYLFNRFAEMMRYFFSQVATPGDVQADSRIYPAFLRYFIQMTAPVMGVAFVAAVAGNVVQTGFLFTTKPIVPDFKRIRPSFGRWISRSFGWPEGVFNLGKTLVKTAIIGVVSFFIIRFEIFKLVTLMNAGLYEGVVFVSWIAFRLLVVSAVLLLVFSLFDYIFQRRQFMESLKMTKHEVKEEFKQTEGDPQIRARIRKRMREILASNPMETVPKADVVVTNPTHFAVALQWERSSMEAPSVTAKGADEAAFRIRKIAGDNDVPIVENKPLARALYDNVEIGDMVPRRYWEVVSRVLAEVYRLKGVL